MPVPDQYSFQRYLLAKRSVEDRALNRFVWDTFASWVGDRTGQDINIVDAGGGTGSMLVRLLETGLLKRANYTILDESEENLQSAREQVIRWAGEKAGKPGNRPGQEIVLDLETGRVRVQFVSADIYDYFSPGLELPAWDLLIAHAVLDLLDLPRALPLMIRSLRPSGGFYFPITFDGLTIFEPAVDPPFDEEIMRLYHRTMDQRTSGGLAAGESRTGRKLIHQVIALGGHVLAAGGSDWVVYPQNGSYPGDEAYFLYYILYLLENSLEVLPPLDQVRFQAWLDLRRSQIDAGELVYIAHQIDLFGVR